MLRAASALARKRKLSLPISRLEPVRAWLEVRAARKGDLTLDDPVAELADRHGIGIHRVSVWRFLRSLGLTHEKALRAEPLMRRRFKQLPAVAQPVRAAMATARERTRSRVSDLLSMGIPVHAS